MLTIISKLARRFLKWGLWLILILLVLWIGPRILDEFGGVKALEARISILQTGKESLKHDFSEMTKSAEDSLAALGKATHAAARAKAESRIAELSRLIAEKKKEVDDLSSLRNRLDPLKILARAKLALELDVTTQELAYTRDFLNNLNARASLQFRIANSAEACARAKKADRLAQENFRVADKAWQSRKSNLGPIEARNPWSAEYKKVGVLLAKRNRLAKETWSARAAQQAACIAPIANARAKLQALGKTRAYQLDETKATAVFRDLEQQIQEKSKELDANLLHSQILVPMSEKLPTALGILASVILLPFLVKAVLYFVVCPLLSLGRPICIAPGTDAGERAGPSENSSVSLPLTLSAGQELILHHAYFQSAADQCKTGSRTFLDARYPLTSLAAGMYNLTSVTSEEPSRVTLSSGHDSLNELALLELHEGEALCLQQRHLVGILQDKQNPVRVTSHWRLGSLQAWLTFQLRYLLFHGPTQIIVKGCRGVRVKDAATGSAIDQKLTIGFSANLAYSTQRVKPAWAYITGKKPLLKDRFLGSGIYVLEEMPHPAKHSGVFGRGIEGLSDAVLKVFGI